MTRRVRPAGALNLHRSPAGLHLHQLGTGYQLQPNDLRRPLPPRVLLHQDPHRRRRRLQSLVRGLAEFHQPWRQCRRRHDNHALGVQTRHRWRRRRAEPIRHGHDHPDRHRPRCEGELPGGHPKQRRLASPGPVDQRLCWPVRHLSRRQHRRRDRERQVRALCVVARLMRIVCQSRADPVQLAFQLHAALGLPGWAPGRPPHTTTST